MGKNNLNTVLISLISISSQSVWADAVGGVLNCEALPKEVKTEVITSCNKNVPPEAAKNVLNVASSLERANTAVKDLCTANSILITAVDHAGANLGATISATQEVQSSTVLATGTTGAINDGTIAEREGKICETQKLMAQNALNEAQSGTNSNTLSGCTAAGNKYQEIESALALYSKGCESNMAVAKAQQMSYESGLRNALAQGTSPYAGPDTRTPAQIAEQNAALDRQAAVLAATNQQAADEKRRAQEADTRTRRERTDPWLMQIADSVFGQ